MRTITPRGKFGASEAAAGAAVLWGCCRCCGGVVGVVGVGVAMVWEEGAAMCVGVGG